MATEAEKQQQVEGLCWNGVILFVCAVIFLLVGIVTVSYQQESTKSWDELEWSQMYVAAFIMAGVLLLNAFWACITLGAIKEKNQAKINERIICIRVLLWAAFAGCVVSAVFFGTYVSKSNALADCNHTHTNGTDTDYSKCASPVQRALAGFCIAGFVFSGLVILCGCDMRSEKKEKLTNFVPNKKQTTPVKASGSTNNNQTKGNDKTKPNNVKRVQNPGTNTVKATETKCKNDETENSGTNIEAGNSKATTGATKENDENPKTEIASIKTENEAPGKKTEVERPSTSKKKVDKTDYKNVMILNLQESNETLRAETESLRQEIERLKRNSDQYNPSLRLPTNAQQQLPPLIYSSGSQHVQGPNGMYLAPMWNQPTNMTNNSSTGQPTLFCIAPVNREMPDSAPPPYRDLQTLPDQQGQDTLQNNSKC